MTYGALRAVDGVSLEVAEGEFVGILGPNGAGKTTTLETIEGSAQAGQRLGPGARPAGLATQPRAAAADGGPAPGVVVLRAADRPRADPHLRRAVRRLCGQGRRVARAGRPRRQGRLPGRGPVGRPGPAAVDRVGAGARAGGRVPRRADRRARPAGPPQPLGPAVRAQRLRPHGRPDHALHGRGRGALRPGRDHGRRQDPPVRLAGRADPRPGRARPDHGRARASSTLDEAHAARRGRRGHGERRTASCWSPGSPRPSSPGSPTTEHLDGVRVQTGTLEDVFLDLTGREYRA